MSGDALTWFTDHLSNNYQRVKLHHFYSTWGLVRGGIPLSSALSPLLFLVYVNDRTSQVKNGRLLQYADDELYYAQVQIRGMFITYYLMLDIQE